MSIFGSSGSSNSLGSTSGNRHSIEFKAGRMNLVDSDQEGVKKKMVHPDSRKGLCFIYYDDGLTHFCWKDRTTGNVEEDSIVFPDDCEFKRVEQCKDGRVFLLKFKSSNRKLFFWLQEPNSDKDKDDEYVRKVNELLNNPPSSGSGGGGGSGNREGSDLQYMLNNMSQQQLMQLFGGVGQMGGLSSLLGSLNRTSGSSNRNTSSTPSRSSTAAAAGTAVLTTPANTTQPATPRAPQKEPSTTESTAPASGGGNTDASRVLLSELQSYLAGINTGGAAGGSKQNVDLSTSLNSESINSILSDPDRLEALSAHLPGVDEEGKPTDPNVVKQQLKDTLASPQFQQALSMFSSALQSGQLGPVVSQFKLSDDAVSAANSGDLEQFVKALEKASIKESSAKDKDEGDKKDESKN